MCAPSQWIPRPFPVARCVPSGPGRRFAFAGPGASSFVLGVALRFPRCLFPVLSACCGPSAADAKALGSADSPRPPSPLGGLLTGADCRVASPPRELWDLALAGVGGVPLLAPGPGPPARRLLAPTRVFRRPPTPDVASAAPRAGSDVLRTRGRAGARSRAPRACGGGPLGVFAGDALGAALAWTQICDCGTRPAPGRSYASHHTCPAPTVRTRYTRPAPTARTRHTPPRPVPTTRSGAPRSRLRPQRCRCHPPVPQRTPFSPSAGTQGHKRLLSSVPLRSPLPAFLPTGRSARPRYLSPTPGRRRSESGGGSARPLPASTLRSSPGHRRASEEPPEPQDQSKVSRKIDSPCLNADGFRNLVTRVQPLKSWAILADGSPRGPRPTTVETLLNLGAVAREGRTHLGVFCQSPQVFRPLLWFWDAS